MSQTIREYVAPESCSPDVAIRRLVNLLEFIHGPVRVTEAGAILSNRDDSVDEKALPPVPTCKPGNIAPGSRWRRNVDEAPARVDEVRDGRVFWTTLQNGFHSAGSEAYFRETFTADAAESKTIRTGDLVVGRRYRIVAISDDGSPTKLSVGDVLICVKNAGKYIPPAPGCIDDSQGDDEGAWFASPDDMDSPGSYVTAVELVEDEAQQPKYGPFCACSRQVVGAVHAVEDANQVNARLTEKLATFEREAKENLAKAWDLGRLIGKSDWSETVRGIPPGETPNPYRESQLASGGEK